MTILFHGDPIPDRATARDQPGRMFTHHQGRFIYGTHYLHAHDLDWPLTQETT